MIFNKINTFNIYNSKQNFYLFKKKKLELVVNDTKDYFKNKISHSTKNINYFKLKKQFNKKKIKQKLEILDKNLIEFKKVFIKKQIQK